MKSICLNCPLDSSKCLRAGGTDFLGYALDEWESEVGTFCALLVLSPSILIHDSYHFVSKQMVFNAHTVMKSEHFRVSFGPKQIFSLSNQQLLNL